MSLPLRCPHCQWSLIADPAQIRGEWSFLKCFHCGGFSMARNQPHEETIEIKKPKIIAGRRSKKAVPPPFRRPMKLKAPAREYPESLFISSPLPQPLPEIQNSRNNGKWLPLAAATAMTISVMLYVQGKVAEKTRELARPALHGFQINQTPARLVQKTVKKTPDGARASSQENLPK